jgi:hypothetical protein
VSESWWCPGVDVAVVQEKARIPLLVREWNIWKVEVSNTSGMTRAELRSALADILLRWLQPKDMARPVFWPAAAPAYYYDYRLVEILDEAPKTLLGGEDQPVPAILIPLAGIRDRKRTLAFPVLPIGKTDPALPDVAPFYVIFVSTAGNRTSLPWPIYREPTLLDGNTWCPLAMDFWVSEAFSTNVSPSEINKSKPGIGTIIPEIIDRAGKAITLPHFLNPTRSMLGLVFWGGVGFFVASAISNRVLGTR